MNFECWITKATDTQSECLILPALRQQQWLNERALMFGSYVHRLLGLVAIFNIMLNDIAADKSASKTPCAIKSLPFKRPYSVTCVVYSQINSRKEKVKMKLLFGVCDVTNVPTLCYTLVK